MRKSYTQSIRDVINEMMKANGMDRRLKESRIINSWPQVVGAAIAKRTARLYISKNVLFVYMNSSVAKQELLMLREGLTKMLNDRVGEKIIDEIVFR